MERYAPTAKDLASRDVVSRAMTIEINEGRGCRAGEGPHPPPPRASRPEAAARAPARHLGDRPDLRRRRRHQAADPGGADLPLQHGRHPDQLAHRGGPPGRQRPGRGGARPDRPSGEAACASVHGANRLGGNSLIDLVVFGRAAAKTAAEIVHPGSPHKSLPPERRRAVPGPPGQGAQRARQPGHGRDPHQHAADHAALRLGVPRRPDADRGLRQDLGRRRQPGRAAGQRPLQGLEQRRGRGAGAAEPDAPGGGDDGVGELPHREPRRACARGLPRARRRQLDEAHRGLDRRRPRRQPRRPAGASEHAVQRGRARAARPSASTEPAADEEAIHGRIRAARRTRGSSPARSTRPSREPRSRARSRSIATIRTSRRTRTSTRSRSISPSAGRWSWTR